MPVRMRVLSALAVAFVCLSQALAEPVKVAESVRNPDLDYWASDDSRFCSTIMGEVLVKAGIDVEKVPYENGDTIDESAVEVICSAFKTPELERNYLFSRQPLDQMHFALYVTPEKASAMMATKITDWPSLIVGYSPVSQGMTEDRVRYFRHATLLPKYVEYPTSASAVEALKNGDVDVLFLYTPFGRRPEGLIEIVPIGDRDIHFAVRKDRTDLYTALNKAFRDYYIDDIERFDELREQILNIRRPKNRVRFAAYERGGIFTVSEEGRRGGSLEKWLKTICAHTRWSIDYVYGDFDECLEDVKTGRLDMVGGIGISAVRRRMYLFPHTPVGMLRAYLWTHPGTPYVVGKPETWHGMKVGILAEAVSAEKALHQFSSQDPTITCIPYSTDSEMLDAYFAGAIDAVVDVEQPALANEIALHVYTAHPMYICTSMKRSDLFFELDAAFEEICDDLPKYQRMISEHHYGVRSSMSALSFKEAAWLDEWKKADKPVVIDFSPWPYPIFDDENKPIGFVARFLALLSQKTGIKFLPAIQTQIQTAEAKFMRGDNSLWVPFPGVSESGVYGAVSVFSLPVPQFIAQELGMDDISQEFELFARTDVPPELVSIIAKVVSDIDSIQLQEMYMKSMAERNVVHRIFGLTKEELINTIYKVGSMILFIFLAFAAMMLVLVNNNANLAMKAARLAEEHAQSKTRFLAMMSHELRTPLNAVVGFAEFLGRKDVSEDRRDDYLKGILLSSHALLELINDILDLSKLEAGATDMRAGECDINQLLQELPAIFGYRVRKHGVNLVLDLPDVAIPKVSLSQQGMRQILINLVGNSAKFTDKGEIRVQVRWIDKSKCLHIEIGDTGCGISEEKLSRLFDPFVQDMASRINARGGEMKGTGLGLPIVKRMVDSAGGTITAQSELGKGTTFTIDIPGLKVIAPKVEKVEAPVDNAPVMDRVPSRVLVVDDMTMNRKILGIHLTNVKVPDVRYAENGVKAIAAMREWVPDIVLTDMWMPDMDGTRLAQEMKRDPRLAGVPIVAVTADVDVSSTYDMALFSRIMAKPVTGEKVRALFGVS